MKLIIDIPEYELGQIVEHVSSGIYDYNGLTATAFKSITNGIPFKSVIKDIKEVQAFDFRSDEEYKWLKRAFEIIDKHINKESEKE